MDTSMKGNRASVRQARGIRAERPELQFGLIHVSWSTATPSRKGVWGCHIVTCHIGTLHPASPCAHDVLHTGVSLVPSRLLTCKPFHR